MGQVTKEKNLKEPRKLGQQWLLLKNRMLRNVKDEENVFPGKKKLGVEGFEADDCDCSVRCRRRGAGMKEPVARRTGGAAGVRRRNRSHIGFWKEEAVASRA